MEYVISESLLYFKQLAKINEAIKFLVLTILY